MAAGPARHPVAQRRRDPTETDFAVEISISAKSPSVVRVQTYCGLHTSGMTSRYGLVALPTGCPGRVAASCCSALYSSSYVVT